MTTALTAGQAAAYRRDGFLVLDELVWNETRRTARAERAAAAARGAR